MGRKARVGFSLVVPLLPLQVRRDTGETAEERGRDAGVWGGVQVCSVHPATRRKQRKASRTRKEKGTEVEQENTPGNNVRSIRCIHPVPMHLWAALWAEYF